MFDRPIRPKLTLAIALAAVLLPVLPAFAQEAPKSVSYFDQFLHTDNFVGTALIWACMLISVAVVSLIIQNALQCRRVLFVPEDLRKELARTLADQNYREAIELTAADQSPLGQVMRAALGEAPRGYQAMEAAVEEMADNVANRRVRGLVWLEIAGAAGPMIGLFGTVYGMILAFQGLRAAGGSPRLWELAGGIATALVCTFWGLVVGIPGVISASLFRVRIEGLAAEVIAEAKQLIAGFRPGVPRKSPSGTPAAQPTPAQVKPAANPA